MSPNSGNPLPEMNAAAATLYVRRMVDLESRSSGDIDGALRRLETHFGLPYWPMVHLRKGRAKSIRTELFVKIRGAYLAYCERLVGGLQDDLANERSITADADLASLEAEAAKLAAKIQEAKARLGLSRGRRG